MRVLPHDQDTSGFFITIFKKLYDFEAIGNINEMTFNEVRERVAKVEEEKGERREKGERASETKEMEYKANDSDELLRVEEDDPDI